MGAQTFYELIEKTINRDKLGRFAETNSSGAATAKSPKAKAPAAEPPKTKAGAATRAGEPAALTPKEAKLKEIEDRIRHKTTEELHIINDDGEILYSAKGVTRSVELDMDKLPKLQGVTITHNHPDIGAGEGGTFSSSDLGLFPFGVKEDRAVCSEGTYSIKRTDKLKSYEIEDAADEQETTSMTKLRGRIQDINRFEDDPKKKEANRNQAVHESLQEAHQWFIDNQEEYGYEYTFTPTGGAK